MFRRQLSPKRAAAAIAVLLATAATAVPMAHAEERTCARALGAVTVDNLRVPPNATCRLTRTHVKGTIKVERNATLVARSVRVVGNVQGENAANVLVLASSRIGGSVQVKQGGGASVKRSRVNDDIQYDANTKLVIARANRVGGSIQVIGNRGGAAIFTNRVDGNLQCKENRPAPTGGANVVGGDKEDQCERF
jgi:hypothetical protein